MPFKVWDNHFGGYMLGADKTDAEFDRKIDAHNSILKFIQARSRRDEWMLRLDVHHLDSNLCYHLRQRTVQETSKFYPWLLPIDFDVPKSEWQILAADGVEITVGTAVMLRADEPATLVGLQPPHKMASKGKVLVTTIDGAHCRYGASVVGGTFKYFPPKTAVTAAGLLWAAREWKPTKPFEVPPPRELALPPRWTECLAAIHPEP